MEIGAGNGGNMIELAKGFEVVVGTDVARPGTRDWRRAGVSYLLADGATCFAESSFDMVAFNPPYMPGAVADTAVDGGPKLEVPMWFLREALRVVRKSGRILMLLNDEARTSDFEEVSARSGFSLRRVGGRHLFYENLTVYEASAIDEEGTESGGPVMANLRSLHAGAGIEGKD